MAFKEGEAGLPMPHGTGQHQPWAGGALAAGDTGVGRASSPFSTAPGSDTHRQQAGQEVGPGRVAQADGRGHSCPRCPSTLLSTRSLEGELGACLCPSLSGGDLPVG